MEAAGDLAFHPAEIREIKSILGHRQSNVGIYKAIELDGSA
jgi:hypothetical protein